MRDLLEDALQLFERMVTALEERNDLEKERLQLEKLEAGTEEETL